MDNLRKEILKQELSRESALAAKLESQGKQDEANSHYSKAASISKLLGYTEIASSNTKEKVDEIEKDEAEIENTVQNLIVTQKPTTKWEDIGNLEEAKKTIKESIILPFIKNKPEFVRSTKTILLYGPPGTGKTLLAKAASNTLNASFFEAKASELLSKYYGESSKLFSELFSLAKKKQPSVIFMDEIDSVVLSREKEIHEATRRVVGELLSQLDGFSTKKEDKLIFIGATNRPWDLDEALLSRFERKVYVPLPDEKSRGIIFSIHLKGIDLENTIITDLSGRTENFSGRDIANLSREAVSNMLREENPGLDNLDSEKIKSYTMKYRNLAISDFEEAFKKIKPTATKTDLEKFNFWKEKFGG